MKSRVTIPIFVIWTIVMISFFFIPMGGSTGLEALIEEGAVYPWLGLVAGLGFWIGLLVMIIRQWLRR